MKKLICIILTFSFLYLTGCNNLDESTNEKIEQINTKEETQNIPDIIEVEKVDLYYNEENLNLENCYIEINVGDIIYLSASVIPNNSTNKTITWISSSPLDISVNNGMVKGLSAGKIVVITAKALNGEYFSCLVKVLEEAILINTKNYTDYFNVNFNTSSRYGITGNINLNYNYRIKSSINLNFISEATLVYKKTGSRNLSCTTTVLIYFSTAGGSAYASSTDPTQYGSLWLANQRIVGYSLYSVNYSKPTLNLAKGSIIKN